MIDRKTFLKTLAVLPLTAVAMKLGVLNKLTEPISKSSKMLVLFLGHGSPMNAIEENEFVTGFLHRFDKMNGESRLSGKRYKLR